MPRSQQRSSVYGFTVECDKCHGKKFLADGVMCWKCNGVGRLYVPNAKRVDWFTATVIGLLALFVVGMICAVWFSKN